MAQEIILILVAFLNLLLSVFVFTQNPRSLNNRFFSLLSLLASLWALANYMTGTSPFAFWLESTYTLGALLVAVGLMWTLVITDPTFNKRKSALIAFVGVVFALSSYLPGFIAARYDAIYIGGVFTGEPGWGLYIYTAFYLLGAFLILWKLFCTSRKSTEPEKKMQFELVFTGALITLGITALTSFI